MKSLLQQVGLLCIRSRSLLYSSRPAIDVDSATKDLAWLVHTRAFFAWMSPPRGEVLCSRWLRSADMDGSSGVFPESFASYFQSRHIQTLFFDCYRYEEDFSPFESLILKYSMGIPPAIAIILWTLVGQAFGFEALKSEEVAARIYERVKSHQVNDHSADHDASTNFICEMLRSSLNFNPNRQFVILLHRMDALQPRDVALLRNAIQDVMDSQRVPEAAQTRAFITCKVDSYDVDEALKGIVQVDRSTEYQGRQCHSRSDVSLLTVHRVCSISTLQSNEPETQSHCTG